MKHGSLKLLSTLNWCLFFPPLKSAQWLLLQCDYHCMQLVLFTYLIQTKVSLNTKVLNIKKFSKSSSGNSQIESKSETELKSPAISHILSEYSYFIPMCISGNICWWYQMKSMHDIEDYNAFLQFQWLSYIHIYSSIWWLNFARRSHQNIINKWEAINWHLSFNQLSIFSSINLTPFLTWQEQLLFHQGYPQRFCFPC